ncbi:phosphate ABC transporter permease PstA [Alloscardovia criceti]|uniref:phosphate ABC transporter permease PstA n=1 Tax=Alloscardovia criceti TaxID=356828 RepID=UPI0003786C3B|nr:phosphate ABC transporter permease PstA [Alloscardovia criceti]
MKPRRHIGSRILRIALYVASLSVVAALAYLLFFVITNGISHFDPKFFEWTYNSDNSSVVPSIIGTILIIIGTLIVSVPLGVGAAIFLTEYSHRRSWFVRIIRVTAETLAGIPSIVYGLFGMLFFVTWLHWGMSYLAGCLCLAIMVLPTVMRTSEEAILAVPDSYREASLSLGATRLHMVLTVVLPAAREGIISGIVLGIGRIMGESAALLFTAGTVAQIPNSFFSSTRSLAVHMYVLSTEGLHMDAAYVSAFVLVIFALLINSSVALLRKKA